ncbi:MAG: ponA [Bacillales bacterium]|jgi:penicillin-binding protein 1A|nr:ponA [Bacillales bacterium]
MTDQIKSRIARRQTKKKIKGKYKKWKIAIYSILTVFVVVGAVVLGIFIKWIGEAPNLNVARLKDPIASKILDKNGEVYTEVGAQDRIYTKYNEIPKLVENALLATEDSRFYKHHGIDIIRLGGAVISNITDGFGSQGGSTLTQQVIKMSFLTYEKTPRRKVQEMYMAYNLENKYTKHQILEMYFNKVNMSEYSYGIGTASQTYFSKPLKELDLVEAAFLVGMPQSPNRYNPYVNPDLANKRKNTVLHLMNLHGYITEKEMKEAQKVDITTRLVARNSSPKNARQVNAIVDQVINEVSALGDYDIYSDGLTIYTTIDPDAQDLVEKILETDEYVKFPTEQENPLQTGVVLLDTATGEVRAIGGWRKSNVVRGFNYATDLKTRQPGSTIKPILDYGPALEYLKWSTYQQIVDEPYKYSDGTPLKNSDNKYSGNISIRYAIQRSKNVPAVKTFQKVGIEKAHGFAKTLGITLDEQIYEAAAIGGVVNGPSPFKLAGAYAAFGNNGIYNAPHTVTKIVTMDSNKTIDLKPKSIVAMKPSTAYMITDMLKTVVQSPGTGVSGNVPGLPMAAKTGTTNYSEDEITKNKNLKGKSPDSWYVGYTSKYTSAVWVGYGNRNTPITNTSIAAQISKALLGTISKNIETPDFKMPNTVVRLPVIKGSNPLKVGTDLTPKDLVSYELFVKGTEPAVTEEFNPKLEFTNPKAELDTATNQVVLTWDVTNVGSKKPEFNITYTIDNGSPQSLPKTTEKIIEIDKPKPGSVYKFTISTSDGQSTATVSFTVPENNTVPSGEDQQNQETTGTPAPTTQ